MLEIKGLPGNLYMIVRKGRLVRDLSTFAGFGELMAALDGTEEVKLDKVAVMHFKNEGHRLTTGRHEG